MLILLPSIAAVVLGLLGICTGFFTVHSAAVGSLNRKLSSGQGRANALYILFYYLGGWFGITCAGFLFKQIGWSAVVYFCAILLLIPLRQGSGNATAAETEDLLRPFRNEKMSVLWRDVIFRRFSLTFSLK